ncbi:hypothetical protein [Agromyces subbeticus]|uniref:hypothetical protein n=1 Tax=Agromyces subbeticus TaxID=293890 RepID=UPI0003B3BACB|nr:hypothetical protein [Agromyces subbeticus]
MSTDLPDRIARYEQRRERGADTAVEHEALYARIKRECGPAVAEFFDREHMMPYETRPHLPWPMRPRGALTFFFYRLLLTVGGFLAAMLGAGHLGLSGLGWSLTAGFVGAAVVYGFLTVLPKLVPPRDLELRERLVQEFTSMLRAESAQAERAAHGRRDERRLREMGAADGQ